MSAKVAKFSLYPILLSLVWPPFCWIECQQRWQSSASILILQTPPTHAHKCPGALIISFYRTWSLWPLVTLLLHQTGCELVNDIHSTRVYRADIFEGGVFHGQNGPQFFCFYKCYDICVHNVCEKRPLIWKKSLLRSEKIFSKYLTSFFGCCRRPNLWFVATFTF